MREEQGINIRYYIFGDNPKGEVRFIAKDVNGCWSRFRLHSLANVIVNPAYNVLEFSHENPNDAKDLKNRIEDVIWGQNQILAREEVNFPLDPRYLGLKGLKHIRVREVVVTTTVVVS